MTAATIIDRLQAIRDRRLPVGYDLEGNTFVSCQSFAESPTRAFCIVTDLLGEHSATIWSLVASILEDPAIPKWVWNAHHELAVLKLAHGITLRGWEDGMAMWFEKWPELPKGLKYAASILTRRPCWTEGISFDEDDGNVTGRGEAFYIYNQHDSAATIELAAHKQLKLDGPAVERYALRKRLIEALTWASLKGVRYDTALADRLRADLEPRLWTAQAAVNDHAGVVLPCTEAELLAGGARIWCHTVKLRKFALPGLQSQTPPVTADASPGTEPAIVGAATTPTAGVATVPGAFPGAATNAPPASAADAVASLDAPDHALLTSTGPVGTVPGEPSGAALPRQVKGAQTGLSPLIAACLDTLTLSSLESVRSNPAPGSPSGAVLPAPAKPKRPRKPKPPPPPPTPLTWELARTIAKKDGDAALREIEHLSRAPDGADDATRARLADLLNLGVNVLSTPAVVALLDRLKLPKVYRRGERGDESARTKDADVLLDLYLRTGHPVTVALLKCVSLRKQLQELDRKIDADGRIRCSFISAGTETDRTVSHKWLTGAGGNLQTVPKAPVNFRKCYVPDL